MQNELLSMAQQFSGLLMEDLIGAPLNAATKANAAMALSQTKFLLETCFYKETKTKNPPSTQADGKTAPKSEEFMPGVYKPVMIEMILERGVIYDPSDEKDQSKAPVIKTVSTKFNLPLLTIIPINSLAVTTVDIGFEMEVKSTYSESEHKEISSETNAKADLEAKLGWGLLSVSIKGSVSYASKDSETHDTHYEKSNSAKYTVNVHADQLPVPKGVNTIIEAFTQAIQPIQLQGPTPIKN